MTITEQKAFLQTYTGKAQAPAHPAQDWADAVKELHFEAQTAPVEFANAYGMYERLTITYEGRTVTARVIRPASAGQHPLLLMYHDLNRGVRGWHHMTRFLALGFGTVALEAEPYKGDWLADPAQAEFRTRYKDALAVAKAALALPWVDAERVYAFGEGFGGGLALLTACLLPQVKRCAVLNPLPGDFAGAGVAGQAVVAVGHDVGQREFLHAGGAGRLDDADIGDVVAGHRVELHAQVLHGIAGVMCF